MGGIFRVPGPSFETALRRFLRMRFVCAHGTSRPSAARTGTGASLPLRLVCFPTAHPGSPAPGLTPFARGDDGGTMGSSTISISQASFANRGPHPEEGHRPVSKDAQHILSAQHAPGPGIYLVARSLFICILVLRRSRLPVFAGGHACPAVPPGGCLRVPGRSCVAALHRPGNQPNQEEQAWKRHKWPSSAADRRASRRH